MSLLCFIVHLKYSEALKFPSLALGHSGKNRPSRPPVTPASLPFRQCKAKRKGGKREKKGRQRKAESRRERAKCGNIIEKEKAKKCEAARRPY